MEKPRKTVGQFLDWIAMLMLFAYGAHNLIINDYHTAALLFGVMGVWSMSSALHSITELLKKLTETKDE